MSISKVATTVVAFVKLIAVGTNTSPSAFCACTKIPATKFVPETVTAFELLSIVEGDTPVTVGVPPEPAGPIAAVPALFASFAFSAVPFKSP